MKNLIKKLGFCPLFPGFCPLFRTKVGRENAEKTLKNG